MEGTGAEAAAKRSRHDGTSTAGVADAAAKRSRHDGTPDAELADAADAPAPCDVPAELCSAKAANLAEKLFNTSSTRSTPGTAEEAGDDNEDDLINDGNSGAAAGTYAGGTYADGVYAAGAGAEGVGAVGADVRKSGKEGAGAEGVGAEAAAKRSRHDGTSAAGVADAAAKRSRHDGTPDAELADAAGPALCSAKAANLAEKLPNTSSTPPAGADAADEAGADEACEDDLINDGNSAEGYGVAVGVAPGSDKDAKAEANVANASSTGREEPDHPDGTGAPVPYVLSADPGALVAICQRLFLTTCQPKLT